MVKNLVIGYGNSLRSDDGIGIRIAEIVADWQLPEVRSLCLHQLTPELAADLATVDLVIFVDAREISNTDNIQLTYSPASLLSGSFVKLHSLTPLNSTEFRSHFSDPTTILALTQAIYGKCPQAWWVIVTGVDFQLGDRFSAIAQKGIAQALIHIKNLLSFSRE